MDKIDQKILNDLSFNVAPTYKRLEITVDEFLKRLNALSIEGYLEFNVIDKGIFKDEPSKIWITEKGENFVESKRDS